MTQQEYLRSKLNTHFNLSELKTLCFDLGLDYSDLPHETKSKLAVGLLDLVFKNTNASNGRNNQLQSLIRLMNNQRPNIYLGDMPND